jgi:Domain of unknown function (DUF4145)
MNGYGLTAAIVQSIASLAWPAAVLAGLWIYRDSLVRLLPLLTVKHKDWEASFRWERAEEEAAKLPEPPATAETRPTPEEKSRFEQIARLSPRGAILEVRANLEEAVRSFAQAVGVPNISPYVSYAGLVRTLRENELIDQNTSALLDDLRAIGNAAAHNQSHPTEDDALRFQSLAGRLIGQLEISTGAAQMPPPGPIPP